MLKKTKFYVGITLIVQAVSFAALFIALCRKKRSVANAILAIAAIGGITGAVLLYLDSKDELKRRKIIAARDACCAEDLDGYDDLYDFDTEDESEDECELCKAAQ
ncbi:MAG: hypothetical protein IJ428_03430 [Clostridia bacterium]|nr:hypothetical protein [Clostridia bacterium]